MTVERNSLMRSTTRISAVCAVYSPGLILTVEEGRWEVEPGEKEESTVEEEVWCEGRMGGD